MLTYLVVSSLYIWLMECSLYSDMSLVWHDNSSSVLYMGECLGSTGGEGRRKVGDTTVIPPLPSNVNFLQ